MALRLTARSVATTLVALACTVAGGARVEAACSFSATGVAFGTYDVFAAAPTDSTGTISYRCDNFERNVSITLSAGTGTFATRRLRQATETLVYNVYVDAARLTVWGDGSAGTSTYFIKNAPNNRWTNLPVYGRIPPSQDVRVGVYTDTIVATINF